MSYDRIPRILTFILPVVFWLVVILFYPKISNTTIRIQIPNSLNHTINQIKSNIDGNEGLLLGNCVHESTIQGGSDRTVLSMKILMKSDFRNP